MKKILIPMALALSLGLSIPAEVSAQSVSIADQTTSIHVTGHSRIEVEPDIAYLSVQFTVSDKKDAAHARGTLEKKFSAVIAKLKELGFTDEQLIAESLYTSKQYDYDVKPPAFSPVPHSIQFAISFSPHFKHSFVSELYLYPLLQDKQIPTLSEKGSHS